MKTLLWNTAQLTARVLNQPPHDCLKKQKGRICKGCEPGQTFFCSICKRERAYCMGGDRDFELCTSCWGSKYRENMDDTVNIED